MTTTEDIQELKGEIRKLSVAIDGLETDAKVTTDKELKISIGAQIIAIMNQITAITNQITAKEQRLLFLEQQGKFHHIFPLSFPESPRCNPLPNLFRHLLITHSGLATTKGKNHLGKCDFIN